MANASPEPSSNPSDKPPQDRRYYNTRTWFSTLLGTATPEEIHGFLQERDTIEEKSDFERCEQQKQWLFQNSMLHSSHSTFLIWFALG